MWKYILVSVSIIISSYSSYAETTVIDAVVASVNENPITLSDIAKNTGASLNLKSLSEDPEARVSLEKTIAEAVLKEEAKAQRVSVEKQEVDQYVLEVAKRNEMTLEQFEQALGTEGIRLDQYRKNIELEIYRSRLASRLTRDGAVVSQTEIDEFKSQNISPNEKERASSGEKKIKLRQILISTESQSEQEAQAKAEKIHSTLENKDFSKIASANSDGAQAQEGGLIGILNVRELNQLVSDAVLLLDEGEHSKVVQSPLGFHIFYVEKIFEESKNDSDSESLDLEAKKILQERKMQDKLHDYFRVKLLKKHAVDRKL